MLYILFLSVLFVYSCTAQLSPIRVDRDSQQFIDEYGRVRIFHGVNVVYKIPPFLPDFEKFDPQNSLTDDDLTNLQKWGFNVIRFYTAWMGVNPTSANQVDQNYLDQLSRAVQMMEDKGIYALLDCHQDVFSRYFCGEGVPDWVAQKLGANTVKNFPFPLPVNITRDPTTGYPVLDQCLQRGFFEYYFTEAVTSGFKMLYTNGNGTLDAFSSFWQTVASRFANRSSVLGYELLNEPPFPELIDVAKIGLVDREYLSPMYKKLHNAIREVDDKHLLFFEPCVADLLETGLTEGPGGVEYNDRQVFSYHVYCIDVRKQGDPKSGVLCDIDDGLLMSLRYGEAKQKKFGGMMLTEFGALINSTEGVKEINRITGLADAFFQSWSYWQFKKFQDITTAASPGTAESFYTDDGELEINKVRALSRSYAQAIAGEPVTMSFEPSNSRFQLVFNINTNILQPTIVYINEDLNYPNGAVIEVNPSNSLTWKSTTRNYYEFSSTSTTKNGTSITILITTKQTFWVSRAWQWISSKILGFFEKK